MFFKRNPKKVGMRAREAYALVFFCVSFLIYGTVSAYFYLYPTADPLSQKSPSPTLALPVAAALFFLYGIYGLIMRTSTAGKIFSAVVTLESAFIFIWQLFLTDLPLAATRLSGAIEGSFCFLILLGLLIAMVKGASIWK